MTAFNSIKIMTNLHRLKIQQVGQLQAFATGRGYFDNSTSSSEPPIPKYYFDPEEPVALKRARLLYQSRKRGMLENDLLLGTFAGKYLEGFNELQLQQYDHLINMPSNDWDIYYWVTGVKETPLEYQTEVMHLLKEHCRNKNRESRIRQPDLKEV